MATELRPGAKPTTIIELSFISLWKRKKVIVAIMSAVLNIRYDLLQIYELQVFACRTANFCFEFWF